MLLLCSENLYPMLRCYLNWWRSWERLAEAERAHGAGTQDKKELEHLAATHSRLGCCNSLVLVQKQHRGNCLLTAARLKGYGFQEVAELRKIFHHSGRNGNGTMSRSQLARVVEQLFPRLAHTMEFRPVLTHLFDTADKDKADCLASTRVLKLGKPFASYQGR